MKRFSMSKACHAYILKSLKNPALIFWMSSNLLIITFKGETCQLTQWKLAMPESPTYLTMQGSGNLLWRQAILCFVCNTSLQPWSPCSCRQCCLANELHPNVIVPPFWPNEDLTEFERCWFPSMQYTEDRLPFQPSAIQGLQTFTRSSIIPMNTKSLDLFSWSAW